MKSVKKLIFILSILLASKNAGAISFIQESENLLTGEVGQYIKPVAVDWDSDGDLDLVVGYEDGTIKLFVNDDDTLTYDSALAGINVGFNANPSVVNWYSQTDTPEIIVGERDGTLNLYIYDSTNLKPA